MKVQSVAADEQDQRLLVACQAGDTHAALALLAAGASASALTRSGRFFDLLCHRTALHLAADAGALPIVRALLAYGAAVDVVDPELRCTPLHFASTQGHVAVCAALAEAGADLEATQYAGLTAIGCAVLARQQEAAAYLLDRGAVFQPAAVYLCLQSFSERLAGAIARRGHLAALREAIATYAEADPRARAHAQFWLGAHGARVAAAAALQRGARSSPLVSPA